MERLLFTVLFLSGFIPLVLSISRKFYLIQKTKTWTDAQTYCRANHADLATISTSDELVKLMNEALKYQFTSSAWIGMYIDVTTWRWSYKNEKMVYSNWCLSCGPPEPNNVNGVEECGFMNPTSGAWGDANCAAVVPFVCVDERYTGTNRYVYYFDNKKSWLGAQSFCRQNHTDLAIARDATENLALKGKIYNMAWGTWIGLSRDSWKWSDQMHGSAVQWGLGQPNNALINENCGFILNGKAADDSCSTLKPFFCYSVITGQLHIKLKIKLNQDADYPTVKAAILQKIKQKLKELGMPETTRVEWRE